MRILYRIINKINGKIYVGQTVNFHNRMIAHKNGRKDRACLVSKAIRKYGIENFIFEKLAIVETHMIDEAEQKAIKLYNSVSPYGYNLDGGGCLNKIQTQQTKDKISKANTGKKRLNVKPISEEHKQRIRECNKGKIRTEENKKKISDTLKSKYALMTPEERSLKCGAQKGKPRTEEEKRKISEGSKGKKITPEHKQNSINGIKAFYASMTPEQRKEYVQNKFKKKR